MQTSQLFKLCMISVILLKMGKQTGFLSQLLSNGRWMTGFYSCHETDINIKAAKYETQKPSTSRETLFHHAWSTYRATKTNVAGWRKLLRKVGRASSLGNKFWLCCSFFHQTHNLSRNNFCSCPTNQPISTPCTFLQPATKVFVAGQVDQARWKTRNIQPRSQGLSSYRPIERAVRWETLGTR